MKFITFTLLFVSFTASTYCQDRSARFRFGTSGFAKVKTQFGQPAKSSRGNAPAFLNTNPGVNRTYDDGYVRVDSTGNDNGKTWNWGVDSSAPTLINNSIAFHSSTFSALASHTGEDSDGLGVNLAWLSGRQPFTKKGYVSLLASFDYVNVSGEKDLLGSADQVRVQYV